MTTIAITGAAGRMGMRLIALAKQAGTFTICAAIERPDHPQQSRDAGEIAGIGPIGVPITPDLRGTPNVLIDFTTPASLRQWMKPAATQDRVAHGDHWIERRRSCTDCRSCPGHSCLAGQT